MVDETLLSLLVIHRARCGRREEATMDGVLALEGAREAAQVIAAQLTHDFSP